MKTKPVNTLLILFGLFFIDMLFNANGHLIPYTNHNSDYLLLSFIVFAFLWFRTVIIAGKTREYILWCVALMAFMFLLRGGRYNVLVEQFNLERYFWYMYYLPCLFIPCFALRAAIQVNMPGYDRLPLWTYIMEAVSGLLLLLVLTNDFTQLVFRFPMDPFENREEIYSHAPVYYLIFVWIFLLLIGSFAVLIYKCRISSCRSLLWIPLLPIVFGLVSLIILATGIDLTIAGFIKINFPDMFCFTIVAAWVTCVEIGLIPSNLNHSDLLNLSDFGIQITDTDHRVHYSSKHVLFDLDREHKNKITWEQGNHLVRRYPVRGGFVYWQSDISRIKQVNEELVSVRKQLEEDLELIKLENELKKQSAILSAQNSLYDGIAIRVKNQSDKISSLVAEAEKLDQIMKGNQLLPGQVEELQGLYSSKMYEICLHGSYIKRMANLMVLGFSVSEINCFELALSIEESMKQLRKMDIYAELVTSEDQGRFLSERLIHAYELFQAYLEMSGPGLEAVLVTLGGDKVKMTLEGRDISLVALEPQTSVEEEDGIWYVRIPLGMKEVQHAIL